jgi:hypothetical protein
LHWSFEVGNGTEVVVVWAAVVVVVASVVVVTSPASVTWAAGGGVIAWVVPVWVTNPPVAFSGDVDPAGSSGAVLPA